MIQEWAWSRGKTLSQQWLLACGPLHLKLTVNGMVAKLHLAPACHPFNSVQVDRQRAFMACRCGEPTPFPMRSRRWLELSEVEGQETWANVYFDPLQAALVISALHACLEEILSPMQLGCLLLP